MPIDAKHVILEGSEGGPHLFAEVRAGEVAIGVLAPSGFSMDEQRLVPRYLVTLTKESYGKLRVLLRDHPDLQARETKT